MDASAEEAALAFTLSDNHSVEDIVAAARGALNRRRWTNVTAEDNTVTARLVHRGRDANLKIVVEGNRVLFFSDSWILDKKGVRKKFEHPAGWLVNLEKDIHQVLGEPWAKK